MHLKMCMNLTLRIAKRTQSPSSTQ